MNLGTIFIEVWKFCCVATHISIGARQVRFVISGKKGAIHRGKN